MTEGSTRSRSNSREQFSRTKELSGELLTPHNTSTRRDSGANSPLSFSTTTKRPCSPLATIGQQHVREDRANSVGSHSPFITPPPSSSDQSTRKFGLILSLASDLALGPKLSAQILDTTRSQLMDVSPDFSLPLLRELRHEVKKELKFAKTASYYYKAQGLMRTALARLHFRQFQKEYNKGRNETLRDLTRNEVKFVQKLRIISEQFKKPLEKSLETRQQIINANDLKTIFGAITPLLSLHEEILNNLNVILENWPKIRGVGQCFLSIRENLSIYGPYVENTPAAVSTCNRLEQSSKKFSDFLNQVSSELPGVMAGVQLVDLLPCPLNQISQYEISLHLMLENTKTSIHSLEEFESLTKATEFMSRLSEVVQVSFEASSSRLKVIDAFNRLGGISSIKGLQQQEDNINNNRRIVGESDLQIISKKGISKKTRERHLFLFSDLAIFAKMNKKSSHFVAKEILKLEEVKTQVADGEFEYLAIPNGAGGTPQKHLESLFVISTPHLTLSVVLPNASEKERLWKELQKLVHGNRNELAVFGCDLHSLLKREERLNQVPIIVEKLCTYLENFLDTEGLFRVNPNLKEAQELKRLFDKGWNNETDSLEKFSPHVAANVLKSWFRELRDPVIGFALYEKLMKTDLGDSDSEREIKINGIIKDLPLVNMCLLRYLMLFLIKVASHSDQNLMTEKNLSIVIGPNLLRPRFETVETTLEMPKASSIIETMICSSRMWVKRSTSM